MGSNELGWVRVELAVLRSERVYAPLNESARLRYLRLLRRERELVRLEERPAAGGPGTAATG